MSATSVSAAIREAGFTKFADALADSGYADMLNREPFTIFAPTDAAFARAPKADLETALHSDDKRLQSFVSYHFVAGRVAAARLRGKRYRAVMFGGAQLIIDGKTQHLRINSATVTQPDISAGASVIHGIDQVLWPQAQPVNRP